MKKVKFHLISSVPGYRGEAVLSGDESSDDNNIKCLRDIVDWYCRKLGRELLSDDDYVLEVQLSSASSLTSSVSSLHQDAVVQKSGDNCDSSGGGTNGSNIVMTEVQILAPDTELSELRLPSSCQICILDAQSTLAIANDAVTVSIPSSFSKQPLLYLKTVPLLTYLLYFGVALFATSLILILVGAIHSGPLTLHKDQAVVVYVLVNRTQIAVFDWLTKQYRSSTVEPELIAVQNYNISYSIDFDDPSEAAVDLLGRMKHFFQSNDLSLSTNVTLLLDYDYRVLSPDSAQILMNELSDTLFDGNFDNVENITLNSTQIGSIEWVSKVFRKYMHHNNQKHGLQYSGSMVLTNYSALLTLPYHNSTSSTNHMANLHLFGENYELYSSSADCLGEAVSVAQYHWMLWLASNFSDVVMSGCYPKGAQVTVELSDLAPYAFCLSNFSETSSHTDVAMIDLSDNTVPIEALPSNFSLSGTGSYTECRQSLLELVFEPKFTEKEMQYWKPDDNMQAHCSNNSPNCVGQLIKQEPEVHTKVQPKLNKTTNLFFASGLFFNTAKDLNISLASPTYDQFRKAVESSCNSNLHLNATVMNQSSSTLTRCLRSALSWLLLTEGLFGLTDKTWNVSFEETTADELKDAVSLQSFLMLSSDLYPDMNGLSPKQRKTYKHKHALVGFGIFILVSSAFIVAVFLKKRPKNTTNPFLYHEFD